MAHQLIKSLDTSQLKQVIALIEGAFEYEPSYHYKDDFFPLFNDCYQAGHLALTDNNSVIAHSGYCLREVRVANETFMAAFVGGIAVHQAYRGQGLFKKIFTSLIEQLEQQVDFFLLWSGDNALYEKFGFVQCGRIYQIGNSTAFHAPLKTSSLSINDIEQMRDLYESSWPNRVVRSHKQWLSLLEMPSIDIYLEKKGGVLQSYAIKNKGFDLQGIVHEFASTDLTEFVGRFKSSSIWSPKSFQLEVHSKLWLAMAKTGARWNPKYGSIESFLNENEIMISGIDSV
tara:strand:- start:8336 stop:9193 length:858 start_codon:yes stop_codon:yes gene_type:complete